MIFATLTVVIYGTYAVAAGACRALLNGERVTTRLRTIAGGVFVFFGVSLCVELIR